MGYISFSPYFMPLGVSILLLFHVYLHYRSDSDVRYHTAFTSQSLKSLGKIHLSIAGLLHRNMGNDMLRSAVGMTHVLRSRLVMDYTTSYFHWSCWDTIWIPPDHMDLCQTHRNCRLAGVRIFRKRHHRTVKVCPKGTLIYGEISYLKIANKIGPFQFLPTGQHGLCFWLNRSRSAPSRGVPSL